MANKGDRALLEPQAKRLYGEGHSRSEISRRLGVSQTTLGNWYKEADKPGGTNEWEERRAKHRSYAERIDDLFDRELSAAEDQTAGALSAPSLDALQKLSGMAVKFREIEARAGTVDFDRPKVFLDNVQFIATWLKENYPEGLRVLAENYDAMVFAFKVEHEKAT
jgi:transposase-like protein